MTASSADGDGIEVGLGFHATVAGVVSGVRFYKGSKNVGIHIGTLWTNKGVELAQVTFTAETATGWQQALFAEPVSIQAGTTYVISYYAPNGRYADDGGYFTSQVHAGPLIARVQDSGKYLHGSRPRFPKNAHSGHNYWVDVVFEADPPVIASGSATPTSATPSSSPPSSTSAPSSGVPANVLDLTDWKLTLPIARSDSPDALEVRQPQLAAYALVPYFRVNAAGDGVVFQSNAGGATTSGSGYPRSELREMTNKGTTEASWSTASGVHHMTVTEASTHLPAAKPQVVTAQIHGASDDIIEIVADGTRSTAAGTYSICVRYNGATRTPCMDTKYVAGTRYTIDLITGGGRIKIDYDGVRKYDFADSVSGCYFKAGAYTQTNTSTGDVSSAYGQVVVYGLRVTSGS